MSARISILVLIGLPGTGKSTFSRWLLDHSQSNFNVVHLCYDDHLQHPATTTEFEYKLQRLKITDILESLVHALKTTNSIPPEIQCKVKITHRESNDFLIVCDDNNYYRSMRYNLYRYCRREGLAYAQVFFVCMLSFSLQRNARRTEASRLPANVIRQMWERLETPNRRKYAWEDTLILSVLQLTYPSDKIIPFLLDSFEHVLDSSVVGWAEVEEEDQQEPSLGHQLDLLLRRRIHNLLRAEASVAAKQAHASLLNDKRKEILHIFKENMESGAACTDLSKYEMLLHES